MVQDMRCMSASANEAMKNNEREAYETSARICITSNPEDGNRLRRAVELAQASLENLAIT